jgi:hypothetical protein
VRLITRNGNDFTARFPLVVAAVAALPVHSLPDFFLAAHLPHPGNARLFWQRLICQTWKLKMTKLLVGG